MSGTLRRQDTIEEDEMMTHSWALKVVLRFIVLIALLMGIPLAVNAQPVSEGLEEYLQSQVAAHRVPGLTFVLVDTQGTVDIRTYGESITPETRFYIGSLSKAMTAVAVMRLMEAGLIDLDAPVQAYLPAFTTQDAERASRVTVRHLLNHTSGLSDQGFAGAGDETDLAAMVAALATARHMAEPGTVFAYFNPHYDVLGHLVEVITGESYTKYLRASLFDPLDMPDAQVHNPAPGTVERLAQGHILPFGFPVPYPPQTVAVPSGGIIASGRDMGAFLRLFLQEGTTVLNDASRDQLLNPPPGLESEYGMGWFTHQLSDGTPIYEHSGDLATFHADMMILPEEGVAFALLYNRQYLLSAFTSFPEIRYGVAATLRGDDPIGGLSARVLGLIILAVVVIVIITDMRRLFLSRRWVASVHTQSRITVFFGLVTLLIPVVILLLLPTLILMLSGQALSDYGRIFAYLPDVMLLLFISIALSVLTFIVRVFLLARGTELVRIPEWLLLLAIAGL